MKICRPWITVRGKRIYASKYGLKAFCFEVDEEKPKKGETLDMFDDALDKHDPE